MAIDHTNGGIRSGFILFGFMLIVELPCYRPATSWVHYTTSCNTQSSVPEDERDQRPKHVELIEIINKPLLLHQAGVYIVYTYASDIFI